MKYHITEQQWFEITDRQRADFIRAVGDTLEDWVVGVGLMLPLPDIGKLIAFLAVQTRERGWLHIETPSERKGWRVQCKYVDDFDEDEVPELCDALWNGVKVLLSEEQEA